MLSGFTLEHPEGIRISRELTEEQLISTQLAVSATHDHLNEWMWYSLPAFKDELLVLTIWLGFKSGKLDVISFSIVDPPSNHSVMDWAEAAERAKTERLRVWLTAKGFPPGEYPWGTVEVVFDEKSGGSSAGIRFGRA